MSWMEKSKIFIFLLEKQVIFKTEKQFLKIFSNFIIYKHEGK